MSEVKFADRMGEGSRRRGLALPFWIFALIAVVAALGAGLVLKQQEQGFLSAMMTNEGERRAELLISASLGCHPTGCLATECRSRFRWGIDAMRLDATHGVGFDEGDRWRNLRLGC